ncbi:unnamed protein product, partial [Closterium sp. Yama58-4]
MHAVTFESTQKHHARAYACVLLYCDQVGGTLKMAVDQQDLVVYKESPLPDLQHGGCMHDTRSISVFCLNPCVCVYPRLFPSPRPRVGGTLKMAVDQQDLVVYKESPGTPEPPPEVREDVRVFERNLTYCSAPMFGAIDTQRLLEWIEFHRSIHGVDYLRMYDAGAMDDDVMAALRPYLRAGIMDITDIKGPALYDTWSYAQVLMVNDCALRSRQLTRWVLFMDVDEYIHVVEPPHSLLVFLNSVPAIPWLSFGSLTFPLDICGKIQEAGWEPWAVEQLVFREPVPHCKEPTKYYRCVCVGAQVILQVISAQVRVPHCKEPTKYYRCVCVSAQVILQVNSAQVIVPHCKEPTKYYRCVCVGAQVILQVISAQVRVPHCKEPTKYYRCVCVSAQVILQVNSAQVIVPHCKEPTKYYRCVCVSAQVILQVNSAQVIVPHCKEPTKYYRCVCVGAQVILQVISAQVRVPHCKEPTKYYSTGAADPAVYDLNPPEPPSTPLSFPFTTLSPLSPCFLPSHYHSRDACLKWDGHRTYAVNPWAAQLPQIQHLYDLNATPPPPFLSPCHSCDACLKWDGHRKYVVNPRTAQVLQIHRVKSSSLVVRSAACDAQMSFGGGGGESQSSSGTSGSQQATQQKQSAPNVAKLDMGGTGFPPRDDDGGGGGGGGGGGRFWWGFGF